MCNPKPGVRCASDTKKSLSNSIENFVAVCETNDKSKIEAAARELNESRVFYYATNYANDNPAEANAAEAEALQSVPKQYRGLLDGEEEALYTGRFLNNFQTVADKYRKRTDQSSLEVARAMYNEGFYRVYDHAKKDNQNKRDERIAQVRAETGEFDNDQTDKIRAEAAKRDHFLDTSYSYAMADAKKVIDRDAKKGSPRAAAKELHKEGALRASQLGMVKTDPAKIQDGQQILLVTNDGIVLGKAVQRVGVAADAMYETVSVLGANSQDIYQNEYRRDRAGNGWQKKPKTTLLIPKGSAIYAGS